jgi:hypothetical protein
VPDAVLRPDGTIWLYFVNGEPGRHGIFVARGRTNGSFEIIDCVKLDGKFEPTAVDPDIVPLSDGRYRMYYYANLGQVGGRNTIRSAISDDGINFRVEGDVATGPYTDPSVAILADGRWLLSIPRGPEGNLVFTSPDGTTFDTAGVMVQGANGTPELVALGDGRVRMYVGGGALRSFISSDGGGAWAQESHTDLRIQSGGHGAGHPSVVQLEDGTWLLFYVSAGNVGGMSPGAKQSHVNPAPGPDTAPGLFGSRTSGRRADSPGACCTPTSPTTVPCWPGRSAWATRTASTEENGSYGWRSST